MLSRLQPTNPNVSAVCASFGLPRMTVYDWRSKDAAFKRAWDQATDLGSLALEDECARRAMGFDRPLVFNGRTTGETVKEYSDTLLMFLLRGRMPHKYTREHTEISGSLDIKVCGEGITALLTAAQAHIKAAATESAEQATAIEQPTIN